MFQTKEFDERNERMYKMRMKGMKLTSMGLQSGISGTSVCVKYSDD